MHVLLVDEANDLIVINLAVLELHLPGSEQLNKLHKLVKLQGAA